MKLGNSLLNTGSRAQTFRTLSAVMTTAGQKRGGQYGGAGRPSHYQEEGFEERTVA